MHMSLLLSAHKGALQLRCKAPGVHLLTCVASPLTLIQLPRLGHGALRTRLRTTARKRRAQQAYHERQAQRQISDVYGGDGYDSPDEVSYQCPWRPLLHRPPDDMPFEAVHEYKDTGQATVVDP
jgi:hypothetical protein